MTRRSPLIPIFLTVFLDMLGVGIIIPVLPALFLDPGTSILAAETTHMERSLLYGYLIAVYPFMQFFGAPALGVLSDRLGRKPVLMVSLAGTLIGYLLFGWAIQAQNLPLLFLSRALPGFTGGNISIVYSAISDITVSEPGNRPRYFGLVGMAFGIGFIAGPALGGVLADSSIVGWFDHSTPFWFTASLTLVNMLFLWNYFPETLKHRRVSRLNFFSGFINIRKGFSSPNLRGVFTVSLLLSLGFSFFTQFFSVYLIQRFSMSVKDIGLIFAWVGVWLVFTQGVIVRRLSQRFSSAQVLRWTIGLQSICIPMLLIPTNGWNVMWINPFIAIFQGISAPNLTTVVSAQASASQQGEILGINQSMVSVGQVIPPLVAGYLNSLNGAYPLAASGITIFLGWLVYMSLEIK